MPGAILAVIGLEKIDSAIFNILFAIMLLLTGFYVFWSPSKSKKSSTNENENQKNKGYWRVYRKITPTIGDKYTYNFSIVIVL